MYFFQLAEFENLADALVATRLEQTQYPDRCPKVEEQHS